MYYSFQLVLWTDLTHDDGAIYGQLQVFESAAHNPDDPLHAVYLLPQEDVHGSYGTHLLQTSLHLVRDIICWQFVQHLLSLLVHNALSCFSSATGTVLGLDGEDGVQALVGSVALIPVGTYQRDDIIMGKSMDRGECYTASILGVN